MQETITHPFIIYLINLRDSDDEARTRAAFAALRRGLTSESGETVEMYRYVVPFLPANAPSFVEDAYFLIAALFALHPGEKGQGEIIGNMGKHFADALAKDKADSKDPNYKGESIERRFTALLATHPDDLAFHLRQAVSFLESKGIQINWHQLFFDVRQWRNSEVQKRWARAFWGSPNKEATDSATQSVQAVAA